MEPQQTSSFDESITQVMQTLPPFIRTYIEQQKYTTVAMGLMAKYKLRIDQGGVLELNLLLLLMGINNPSEFTKALVEKAKLDQQTVNSIVQDVNEQIFVPLRKEEEKGAVQPAKVAVPTPPPSAPQPVSYFKLENKIPLPRPVSQPQKNVPPPTVLKGGLPPKAFLPRPSSLGEVVRSILAVPKPLDNSTLLEDHEEPHIAFEAESPEVEPRGISARPVVAPENLPGVMLEQVIPEAPIPEASGPFGHNDAPPSAVFKVELPMQFKSESLNAERQIQPAAPIAPVAPEPITVAPITSYSSDPYHEPIDEPPT